jgi:hypothetical protein
VIAEDAVLGSGLSPDRSPAEIFRAARKAPPKAAGGKGRKPKP